MCARVSESQVRPAWAGAVALARVIRFGTTRALTIKVRTFAGKRRCYGRERGISEGNAVVRKRKRSGLVRSSQFAVRSRSRNRSRSESKRRELRRRSMFFFCYVHSGVFIPICGFKESILSPYCSYSACSGDWERV